MGTKSHSLKVSDLETLRKHAIDEGLEPCYMIEDENHSREWFIIEKQMFDLLMDLYRNA